MEIRCIRAFDSSLLLVLRPCASQALFFSNKVPRNGYYSMDYRRERSFHFLRFHYELYLTRVKSEMVAWS